MSQSSGSDDEMVTGINVTPLVDVTLVLLIIFMVTAKLIAGQGIPLDLPKAASAGAVQTVFAVSITQEGEVRANGSPAPSDLELRRAAKDAVTKTPDLRTVIQASRGVPYGTVLHVMDELRETGITKIAFATDPISPDVAKQLPSPRGPPWKPRCPRLQATTTAGTRCLRSRS